MSVPNTFAADTSPIPLSQLDANFAYYDAAYQLAASTMSVNYTFQLKDVADNTKIAQFIISGITTATTRQFTMPNASGTFALLSLAQTWTATQTYNAAIASGNFAYTWSGTTTNYSINAGQTTGTIVIGGTAGTGAITVGQSTGAQTLNFGTGATTSATTKTVNIGTAGVSGSTTNINIGSAVAGSLGAINLQSNTTVAGGYTLTLGAGTSTLPPFKFTAGVLDASPEAGAWNYDGNVFYANNDLTSGRGLVAVSQIFRLTADGAAIGPTIANFFGATSGKSLDASTFYEVEYCVQFTKTTAGTVTFTMTFSNAPINSSATYVGTPVGGVGTVGAAQTAAIVKSTATAGALPATGSLTTGVNHYYTIKAVFQANATTGGTLNLQATSSAGTITPLAGSYYKVTRLPSANTGSFV